jgi:SOS response regulatory protein OraA/RecX
MGDTADMTHKHQRFLISKGFYDEKITRADP